MSFLKQGVIKQQTQHNPNEVWRCWGNHAENLLNSILFSFPHPPFSLSLSIPITICWFICSSIHRSIHGIDPSIHIYPFLHHLYTCISLSIKIGFRAVYQVMDEGVGVTLAEKPLYLVEGKDPEVSFSLNTTQPVMFDTYYEGWFYYFIHIRWEHSAKKKHYPPANHHAINLWKCPMSSS